MSPVVAAVLAIVAVASAALSAVTGVAGGIILLSALLLAVAPSTVVPIHGAVQLVANAARIAVFWRHIRWDVVQRFSVAVLPGSIAGMLLVSQLSPRMLQIGIAVAILLSLVARKPAASPARGKGLRWFYPLGLLCGGLGMLVGSTGPVVTQALLWSGTVKEEHIATKAACQAAANLIKLTLYGTSLGFAFGDHAALIAMLAVGVVAGTLIGRSLLRGMSQGAFVAATRLLLAAIAIKALIGI